MRNPSRGWWAIEVPEVDGVFTRAKRLDQVSETVADAVRTMLDLVESATVEVDVQPDLGDDLARQVSSARKTAQDAAVAQETASKAACAAVAVLREQGMPVRDVAALLRVSHQRVSQLAKG